MTSVTKMQKWNKISQKNCYNNYSNASPLQVEITENIKWNIYKPPPKKNNNTIELFSVLNFDKILSNYLTQRGNESENDCNTLRILSKQFIEMNTHLNLIATKMNTTSLEQIIDKSLFIKTIYDMIDENLELPFIINENTTIDFFNNIKIEFFQSENSITIKFEIPLYIHTQFFRVYVKPIMKKKGPLIAKTNVTHAAFTLDTLMFWNSTEFRNLCYVRGELNKNFGETFFCEKTISDYQCEYDLFRTNKRDKNCLEKISKRNIITRIHNKFYITVYHPMVLQIICGEYEYFMQIIDDSFLVNDKNCFINSSFYSFNPNNLSNMEVYELKVSNKVKLYDFNFWEDEDLDSEELTILISFIAFVAFLSITSIMIVVCIAKQKIKEIYEIAQHEYATIDYYTNVHQFLESDV